MIKYCDECKFNTIQNSKSIPTDKTENTLDECPICGNELYVADCIDDID